jgi:hypothetical protein
MQTRKTLPGKYWLVTILKEIKKDATREDAKKKIGSLQPNYRNSLETANYSKRLGIKNDEAYYQNIGLLKN